MEKYGVSLSGRYTLSQLQVPAKAKNKTDANLQAVQMQVFPNPAVQAFAVSVQKMESKATTESDVLFITDLSGRVVREQKISYNTPVKIEGLMPGVYLLKLASQQDIYQKVVVQ